MNLQFGQKDDWSFELGIVLDKSCVFGNTVDDSRTEKEGSRRMKWILNSIQVARHRAHAEGEAKLALPVTGIGMNRSAVLSRHPQCVWSHWDPAIGGLLKCHLRIGDFEVLFIFKKDSGTIKFPGSIFREFEDNASGDDNCDVVTTRTFWAEPIDSAQVSYCETST